MLTLTPVSLAQANEFVRQHHRHHPGGGAVDPVAQKAPEPLRRTQGGKAPAQGLQKGKERLLQKGRGSGGAPNGKIEHGSQQKKHGRDAHQAARKEPIQAAVQPVGRLAPALAGGGHGFGPADPGGGDAAPHPVFACRAGGTGAGGERALPPGL